MLRVRLGTLLCKVCMGGAQHSLLTHPAPARARPGAVRGPVRVFAGATKEGSKNDAAARQMLGMKGAALETDKFKIRVQLTKPVTWVPLIWGR